MKLYKSFDIWKKTAEDELVRYRCFEILSSGQFCVQCADFFQYPPDQTQNQFLTEQFYEFLLDEDPDKRSKTFASIEEAIKNYDAEFGSPEI